MPKIASELSALAVKNLSASGLHAVGGVPGLHLQITNSGARSWVLRVRVGSKRRDVGLGSYPSVSLAQARQKARETREQVRQGIDPILERQAAKARLIAAQSSAMTFDEAAQQFMKSKAQELAPKQAAFWRYTLSEYASPIVGKMDVSHIELAHIVQVLEPIWATKTETAKRLRGRIESVLAWATVRGYRTGDNPARWKRNLDAVLPKPGRIAKTVHLRALPYSEMPVFMQRLLDADGQGAKALTLAILTATRSGEVRGATWEEIDLEARTWTIPADRMKTGIEHRVPMSNPVIALLESLPAGKPGDLVFPAPRGGMLSDMTISAVTRRMEVDAVPHGFRSTFRDWAAETTHFPRDVCEMALAHVVRGVEGAYRRGDLFEKRRRLMDAWATYITGSASSSVAMLRKVRSNG
jgi:integrase